MCPPGLQRIPGHAGHDSGNHGYSYRGFGRSRYRHVSIRDLFQQWDLPGQHHGGARRLNVWHRHGAQHILSMKTSTLVVGSSFVAVKVLSADPVALVTVREDDSVTGWPTTSIIVAAPLSTDVAVQYAGGSAVTFPAPPLTRW